MAETRLRWQAMASLGLGIKLLLGTYAVSLLLSALISALMFVDERGTRGFDPSAMQQYFRAHNLVGLALAILAAVAWALIARAPKDAAVGPLAWGVFVLVLAGPLVTWSIYGLIGAGVVNPMASSGFIWVIRSTISGGLWLVARALTIVVFVRLARWLGKPLGAPILALLVGSFVVERLLVFGEILGWWVPELAWREVTRTTAYGIIANSLTLLELIAFVVACWLLVDGFKQQPKPTPRELPAPPPGLPPGAA